MNKIMPLRRLWEKQNYRMALILALVAGIWLSSGLGSSSPQATSVSGPLEPSAAMTVRARYVDGQTYRPLLKLRARTEADKDLLARAEISGQVLSLPVAEGTPINKGDVLCQLAPEDRQLRLAELQAEVRRAQLEYDAAMRLKSSGYQSKTAIASARAVLEAARANMMRRQLDVEKLAIRAPFAGVVDNYPAVEGDFLQRGDVCAHLLSLDPLVVSAQVSEGEAAYLQAGQELEVVLLNGEPRKGVLRFVSRSASAVTRTFRIEAVLDNPGNYLRSGLSAQLILPVTPLQAHLIPASLLALDDAGSLGVRVLTPDHRVEFIPVSIVGDDREGIWVAGLAEKTLLITVGQEYVTLGQQVAVHMEQDDSVSAARL